MNRHVNSLRLPGSSDTQDPAWPGSASQAEAEDVAQAGEPPGNHQVADATETAPVPSVARPFVSADANDAASGPTVARPAADTLALRGARWRHGLLVACSAILGLVVIAVALVLQQQPEM